MFGLLGPNGAGKTTLMRAVATLSEPDEGQIFFGDLDVRNDERRGPPTPRLPAAGVRRLPARRRRSRCSITWPCSRASRYRAERRAMVDHLLQVTNLWDVRKRKLGTFSGGMRQRFGIAQALIGDPRLIIVDEPTAGLDPGGAHALPRPAQRRSARTSWSCCRRTSSTTCRTCAGEWRSSWTDELRCQGEPRAVSETLRGTIWRKAVTRDELAGYRAEHAVLGTRWQAGRLVVHILSGDRPAEGFEPVPPDLRDLYFHTLGRHSGTA